MRRDELMHYGMPRRSGRYPWGSGEDPYQHSGDFMNRVNELRKQGVSEVDIAKMVGVGSTTNLRAYYAVAKNQVRADTLVRSAGSWGEMNPQFARCSMKRLLRVRARL